MAAPERSPVTAQSSPQIASHRLIVALDVPSAGGAFRLVDQLEGACRWFKVGLELYLAEGNAIVTELKRRGFSVFLDLKLHDIPNTVAAAVRSAARTGADLLTVHTTGGPVMLTAAVEAARSESSPITLLGVTVLTSMDAAQLEATGVSSTPAAQVLRLSRMGAACGLAGFVASAEEVAKLRGVLGPSPALVIPGIRPAGADTGDQKRIATPAAALHAGATYLVVGRPITLASNPLRAATAILEEMQAALG